MMAAPVATTKEFSSGTPRKLFQGHFIFSSSSKAYDVSADGRRFLMDQRHVQAPMPVAQIVVVQN
jgi:hypothetical protein